MLKRCSWIPLLIAVFIIRYSTSDAITKGLLGQEDFSFKYFNDSAESFTRSASIAYSPNLHKIDWRGVDVLQSYGDGVNRNNMALGKAIDDIGTSVKRVLWFSPGTWMIADDITIPSNLYLAIPAGAVLFVSSGHTLTINSPNQLVAAPNQQIFSGSGKVIFTNPGCVTPDYFSNTFHTGLVNAANSRAGCIELVSKYIQTATATISGVNALTIVGRPGHKITVESNDINSISTSGCDKLTLNNINIEAGWAGGAPNARTNSNKLLLATECDRLRVMNCVCNGMVLVKTQDCEGGTLITGNYVNTGVSAIKNERGYGFDYAVAFYNNPDAIVSQNIFKNLTVDGVKIVSRRGKFGHRYVISNNLIDGCNNDDGIDIYDSGDRVTITGNVITNCQKGINVKDTGLLGNSGKVTIIGNSIYGGMWNDDGDHGPRQNGIAVLAKNVIIEANIIEAVEGIGIHVNKGSENIVLANNLIRDIRTSDVAYGIWIKSVVRGVQIRGGIIDSVKGYGITLYEAGDSTYVEGVEIYDPSLRGIDITGGHRLVITGCRITTSVAGADYGIRINNVLSEESVIRDCEVSGFSKGISGRSKKGMGIVESFSSTRGAQETKRRIKRIITVDLSSAAAAFTVYTVPAGTSFIPLSVVARMDQDCAATNGDYWAIGVDEKNRRTDYGVCRVAAADSKHSANASIRWVNSLDKTCQMADATEVISLISVADTTRAAVKSNNIGGSAGDQVTVILEGYLLTKFGSR